MQKKTAKGRTLLWKSNKRVFVNHMGGKVEPRKVFPKSKYTMEELEGNLI